MKTLLIDTSKPLFVKEGETYLVTKKNGVLETEKVGSVTRVLNKIKNTVLPTDDDISKWANNKNNNLTEVNGRIDGAVWMRNFVLAVSPK